MRDPATLRGLRNRILEKASREKPGPCRSIVQNVLHPPEPTSSDRKECLWEWPFLQNRGLLPSCPTDVQKAVIPYILAKESISVVSKTGSGKTLSYVLPYVHILESEDKRLLVVVPTRELVSQVSQVFRKFSEDGLRVVEITGEVSIDLQRLQISEPFNIVVSTPGRLKELMKLKSIGGFEYVVIDEADRLMQDDFGGDLAFILEEARAEVVSLFSATSFEWDGVTKISVGDVSVSGDVEEFFLYTERNEKQRVLDEVLSSCKDWFMRNMGVGEEHVEIKKVVVFCNTIKMCESLHKRFGGSLVLHSKKTTEERKAAVESLEGERAVLITTDLGGRGIDIKNVDLVINYDLPKTVEAYVHRCGRAGRQKKGISLSMVCQEDRGLLPKLKRLIERKGKTVPEFMNVKEDIILD
ncbi:putative ATP-dependent RNA helicase [Encephalitozoon hellem ATCC 50504]|uniref:ATP-dependent RNA helicase n=1 Tax=Encephalitozoon hellem TaxID=27973 RepID=A0A9Q9C330_ENCHE|nr:putative ATP-dependent RNA helicase [Encephalitozoon hellem ATCC 50504]AFM98348.1 putative ATP-dependent RNA helicase [Encephalitozoon hellem ATCC 50504]UTX43229.1 DEAD box RNA helicase [Encephalitozoon hellem]|eukprot:XP_003887329.1 putative ATP-dependent RNA helicase [Encephalitozoon hellem ATCC 50504]